MIDEKGAINELPKRAGVTWYVNSLTGAATNSGSTRRDAFALIATALGVALSGDKIVIAEGDYDEDLDVVAAQDGLEIECEAGVILRNTAPGTVLAIAGDSVRVTGYPRITQAGQTGVEINGTDFYGEIRAVACAVGFDINGDRSQLEKCMSLKHTTTGFDISSEDNHLERCIALGTAATRGYYLSTTDAHTNLLRKCTSMDNTAGGYECVAGADENMFDHVSQGELCGGPTDAGANNTWIWSEESQIAVANSIQQDLADIHNLVFGLDAAAVFSMDYWSDPVEEVAVAAAAGTLALPDVTVADLNLGTVVRVIAMFKARVVENTNVAVNSLDGATVASTSQVIQVRDDTPGTWRDAINFVDDQFSLAASTREGGDILMGQINIAVEVDANDTYNFQWLLAKANQNNLQFNGVQVGLRVWYQP